MKANAKANAKACTKQSAEHWRVCSPMQTYVFDKTGKVALVFRSQLNSEKHIEEALAVIKTL